MMSPRVKHLYLRSWWRRLLSKVLPVYPAKVVVVDIPFKADPLSNKRWLLTAESREYGVKITLNTETGTASSMVRGNKVVGYDLDVHRTVQNTKR